MIHNLKKTKVEEETSEKKYSHLHLIFLCFLSKMTNLYFHLN
ncbi:DUF1836 domain-containing protein [Bacillus velezensis]|nr:DUF1836 domain-containing protein [Bacillus velezensis]